MFDEYSRLQLLKTYILIRAANTKNAANHAFSIACFENSINQKLTHPACPQTSGKAERKGSLKTYFLFSGCLFMLMCVFRFLEPVFTICIGRFYDIKAWIQGKKHSKVEHLASIFNAVAAFLGHERCLCK